MLKKLDFAGN